jgi:DNA (cytosine-5)-methyltransferase 1
MRYLSVCSGIEAATVAWEPLGWSVAAFAEIEKFPSAVLAHHYPNVPNLGDFTKIEVADVGAVDVLVGGTPCQSFSVAGLRGGLADDRGNLALEFLRLADRTRPKWLVWENVPGVLSSNGGRDFGSILGGMVELGYGFAYRVADAQFFGVPQRRRRVFVVGHLGDWRRAAAVLFERHSLQGHSPPSRKAGQGSPPRTAYGIDPDCFDRSGEGAGETAGERSGLGIDIERAYSLRAKRLRADGFDASEDGTGRGTPIIPIQSVQAVRDKKQNGIGVGEPADPMFTLTGRDQHAIALHTRQDPCTADVAFAHDAASPAPNAVQSGAGVRRLTPRECERLQGFPDDYTLIRYRGKPAADGPRYKALGNSMAVPVMRWIGERVGWVSRLQVA